MRLSDGTWGWWWGCCWACSATTSPTVPRGRTGAAHRHGGRGERLCQPPPPLRSARRRLRASNLLHDGSEIGAGAVEGKEAAVAAASASAVIAEAARAAMAPLLQLHLERRERVASGMAEGGQPKLHRDAETADIRRVLQSLAAAHENPSSVVPLTFSQRLPLGEALVLAVRWAGNGAAHYAPIILPALLRGARRQEAPAAAASPAAGRFSFSSFSSSSSRRRRWRRSVSRRRPFVRRACRRWRARWQRAKGWAVHRYAMDLRP